MSFRDLKDEIYLVLQISGGHGFGFATSPLVITANLAGNIHESFITEPCPQPKFENEFVWIMDKAKMKSIWSDKVPVRVECFTVSQSRRNRIGYIILNVKDAQIILDESKIKESQIRLLGLSREVSLLKPELILSFYITDVPIQSPKLIPQFIPPLNNNQTQMADGPLKVIFGTGKEHFSLCINVVAVSNLKDLLPSHSEVDPDLLTFSYNLMGALITSNVSTHHGVQLAITSSLATLKTYFVREPMVVVSLYLDTLLVGEASINMENLLMSDELYLMKTKHYTKNITCRCVITPSHNVYEIPLESRPSVDFNIRFNFETPTARKKPEVISAPHLSSMGAGGDADNSQHMVPLQVPPTLPLVTRQRTFDNGGETYRAQPSQSPINNTITVTVTSLQLEQPQPQYSWLRLNHPCASVSPLQQSVTPDNWVALQWHLAMVLPQHLLQPTIAAQPITLQLGVGEQVIAEALLQPPDSLTPHMTQEYMVPLQNQKERVGEVGVTWTGGITSSQSAPTLTDTSFSATHHSRNVVGDEVLSPRARELKILSFVEELEDWAEKQRILVMEGLKEEEAARLTALQNQWEAEVGGQVAEGRQLVNALHSMRDQLRHQESELRDNHQKLKMYKEELEQVHRRKLQEFKDLSRRMQDEFNHKLALIASDKGALEQEVKQLREENSELKRTLKENDGERNSDKSLIESLTHDLKMLKEKLSMEQESKQFFKDHCRKAEQEIQRLNGLRQQDLEARLHSEKKSLEQLALQQIVVERNDLRQDQQLLREIRHQLLHSANNADINSNSNQDMAYRDGHSLTDERHIRRAT